MEKLISIDLTKPPLKQILYFLSSLNKLGFFPGKKHKQFSHLPKFSFIMMIYVRGALVNFISILSSLGAANQI